MYFGTTPRYVSVGTLQCILAPNRSLKHMFWIPKGRLCESFGFQAGTCRFLLPRRHISVGCTGRNFSLGFGYKANTWVWDAPAGNRVCILASKGALKLKFWVLRGTLLWVLVPKQALWCGFPLAGKFWCAFWLPKGTWRHVLAPNKALQSWIWLPSRHLSAFRLVLYYPEICSLILSYSSLCAGMLCHMLRTPTRSKQSPVTVRVSLPHL